MLRELSVQNLALIEDVRVELEAGFCAWTGETGAGKSLLLGALGLLLGERSSVDLIRNGQNELRVIGRFEITRPELKTSLERILDRTIEDGELVLQRRLQRAGRSGAYINEAPVSLATLREIGTILVDIHGQRESQSLLEPGYQLEVLDSFGDLWPLRNVYQQKAELLRECRRQYHELSEKQQTRQRELSLMKYEREEIDAADLHGGELAELLLERNRLINAQSLQGFTAFCYNRLYDDEGAIAEQVGRIAKESQACAVFDPRLAEISTRLDALLTEVRDIADTCHDLGESFAADPFRLEEVEERITLIRRLESKYRRNSEQILAYRATLDEQEGALQKQEHSLEILEREMKQLWSELKKAAEVLSKGRAKVAKKLASETQKHLVGLGMPHARLETGLELVPLGDDPLTSEVPERGIDRLELMLAANPGEPPRPLRKVASGGEMSRTMLSLKSVLADHDPVGTMIFDEIDANVGGRLGDVLGQKLNLLGKTHQVICVTHLPQVACYASSQWTIRKQTKGKRTSTTISPLSTEEERLEEIAHMMRGDSAVQTTREEAAEMLRAAKKKW